MTITLAQLREQSRQRADQEFTNYITDSELNGYINSSIAELHDLLIGAYDSDYYVNSVSFTTTANVSDYSLPDGTLYTAAPAFYKLRGVDMAVNGTEWFTLRPFNFNERNRNLDASMAVIGGPDIRYRLTGSKLKLSPVPTGVHNCRLWYIPVATKLVADSDTLSDLNQYAEYVIVDAAIKMATKEESDTSVLMNMKANLAARIVAMAQNRDAGASESISDIYAENNDYYFFRNN